MNQWKAKLEQLESKLNGLSLRERAILLAVLLVAMLGLYDHLALTPYLEKRKEAQSVLANHADELAAVQAQMDALVKRMKHDPNQLLKERIQKRKQYLKELEAEIGESTANLIAPEKMSQILGYLLSRQSGMAVKTVKNFPAEPISFQKDQESEPQVLMYRHRLKMELEGTYFQVTGYLKMIEGLKERLYWDDMSFKIQTYPKGLLTLNVHTLSLSKELIGVYE